MTIELKTGFVGSGKSYAATKDGINIADASFGKKVVIANFPIKDKKSGFISKKLSNLFKIKKETKSRWIYKNNEELTVEFLMKTSLERGFNKKEGSCLVIFDEASIPFNARSWNDKNRLKWIEFLSQSRKFGYDFIFITQDAKMLDKQIRALCEYEVQYKKLNNMMYFKWLSLFKITLFAGVSYWNGVRNSKGSLKLYFYSKKVADRYDTLKLFGQDLEEDSKDSPEVTGV